MLNQLINLEDYLDAQNAKGNLSWWPHAMKAVMRLSLNGNAPGQDAEK